MPIWAIVFDVLMMLGLLYAAAASCACSLFGLGLNGDMGHRGPLIFVAALVSIVLLLYHPMTIPHLLGAAPLPDWTQP